MKKCTVGNRHKWEFLKNIKCTMMSGRSIRISLKGLYQCACGAKKHGEHQ